MLSIFLSHSMCLVGDRVAIFFCVYVCGGARDFKCARVCLRASSVLMTSGRGIGGLRGLAGVGTQSKVANGGTMVGRCAAMNGFWRGGGRNV